MGGLTSFLTTARYSRLQRPHAAGREREKKKKKEKKKKRGGEGTTNGSRGPAWPPAHASSPPLKGTLVRRIRNESPDGKREGEEERKKERQRGNKTEQNTHNKKKQKGTPTDGSRGPAWPPAHASSPPLKEPEYAGDATKERGGKRERRKTKKKKKGGEGTTDGSRGPA